MYYTNPIVHSGADPWVVYHNNYYYYCHATDYQIFVAKSKTLTGIGKVPLLPVWRAPLSGSFSDEIWASELHLINDKWFIYFSASDGITENHRMYAIEGATDDPQGAYVFRGRVTKEDQYAIDGTVMQYHGNLYFIWSAADTTTLSFEQKICIAPMENPLRTSSAGICISTPAFPWECYGPHPVNEGPSILQRCGKTFLIYSASHSFTDQYCLGMLELVGNNPLDSYAWKKLPSPVFCASETVFGPGHPSFTVSPDGSEDWIVYHAARYSGSAWDRVVHTQKIIWDDRGYPVFGKPYGADMQIPLPSGEIMHHAVAA